MKKFIYHYSILTVALIQGFIWFIYFYGIINEINSGYADSTEIILLTIFIVVSQLLLSWLLDGGVRGFITVKHMVFMAFLVSPIRPILQIISLVVLHRVGADSEFGERRDYNEYKFSSWFNYVLFSSETIKITASGRKFVSPAEQRRRDEARANTERIRAEREARRLQREASLKNMKSSSSTPSVIIAPLVLFGSKWYSFYYFDMTDRATFQVAKITAIKVNGVNFLEENDTLRGTPHLYLKPGSYTISVSFTVKASGLEVDTINSTHTFKDTCSMSVNIPYDGSTVYLALVASVGYTWTQVTRNDGSTYAENIRWQHKAQLSYSSKEKCDSVYPAWCSSRISLP